MKDEGFWEEGNALPGCILRMEMVDKVVMLRVTMMIKPKEGKVCFFMFFFREFV